MAARAGGVLERARRRAAAISEGDKAAGEGVSAGDKAAGEGASGEPVGGDARAVVATPVGLRPIASASGAAKGRPKGSRNRLGVAFVEAMLGDFEQHGRTVISSLRDDKPEQYLRIVASILPKEIELGEDAIDTIASVIHARRQGAGWVRTSRRLAATGLGGCPGRLLRALRLALDVAGYSSIFRAEALWLPDPDANRRASFQIRELGSKFDNRYPYRASKTR